jgi:hypothetical protein
MAADAVLLTPSPSPSPSLSPDAVLLTLRPDLLAATITGLENGHKPYCNALMRLVTMVTHPHQPRE